MDRIFLEYRLRGDGSPAWPTREAAVTAASKQYIPAQSFQYFRNAGWLISAEKYDEGWALWLVRGD